MSRFNKLGRAAMVALVLGATALSAAPAQAQLSFGFGHDFGFRRHSLICIELTDYQLRNAVSRQGYRQISLNVRNDRRIQVRATRGGWVYLLRVDTCTGAILKRDRLRPA